MDFQQEERKEERKKSNEIDTDKEKSRWGLYIYIYNLLCCSVYYLCVNVYCITATGC